jgi:polysaccharide biosynthesis/export protein
VQFPKQIFQSLVSLTLWLLGMVIPGSVAVAQLVPGEDGFPMQQSVGPIEPNDAYALGGGDTISITFFRIPEFSGQYQIPADGVLTLPLIGQVSVQGLTLGETQNLLLEQYQGILRRPIVTVTLQAPRPLNVWIAGEIYRPGSYTVPLIPGVGQQPGTQYPTVTRAIEQAGGIRLTADTRRIEVRRRQGNNQEVVFNVNLLQMLQTGDRRQDITLRDGDTIFIPTSTSVNLEEARLISTTSFARDITQPRTVTVVGEVIRPGSYAILGADTGADFNLGGLPTVTRALQIAGGITPRANIRQIQLRRTTQVGAPQIISLDLWQYLNTGDVSLNTILQDGDTIVVPHVTDIDPGEAITIAEANFSPETIPVTVVGEVINPGPRNILPNTPLNQAILAAGGFRGNRAEQERVELIRVEPDGRVSQREVTVDLNARINEQTNPLLRSNDIILVNRSGIVRFNDAFNNVLDFTSNANRLFTVLDFLGILQYLRLP